MDYQKLVLQLTKKCRTIINANQKGGVGKTTSTAGESMVATLPNAMFNKKVLLIDWDIQANETSLMGKTFDTNFPKTIYQCILDEDLQSGIVKLTDNLHMIAGGRDMAELGDHLEDLYPKEGNPNYKKDRTFHFTKLLDKIKDNYDYIWIDVGPSTDIKVDNAMVCADYFVITQETKTYSFEGSLDIINEYFQTLIDDFGDDFKGEVLGLLPFLLQPKRELHQTIIDNTREAFGDNFTFNAIVGNSKRLEDYPEYGITVIDHHDRKVFALFADIFCEIEERIALFETQGDIPEDYQYQPKFLNGNKFTKLARELDLSTYEVRSEQHAINQ
ncbi:AAA family ATPase [Enterococcus sp. LJL120]